MRSENRRGRYLNCLPGAGHRCAQNGRWSPAGRSHSSSPAYAGSERAPRYLRTPLYSFSNQTPDLVGLANLNSETDRFVRHPAPNLEGGYSSQDWILQIPAHKTDLDRQT